MVGMDSHLLALYVAAVFLAMIAPGPDMMFILATGMRGGARAGLLATLGVVSSEIVQITAVAAGLSALFAEVPVAFAVLRRRGVAAVPGRSGAAERAAGPLAGRLTAGRVGLRAIRLSTRAVTSLANPKS